MIKERIGNLVEEVTHGIIVHQVNAQGVMRSGIAKELREKYPSIFAAYAEVVKPNRPDHGKGLLGSVIPVEVIADKLIVVNLVAQQFYGREPPPGSPDNFTFTDYNALFEGFIEIDKLAHELKLPIHLPRIGCGLARGDWLVVKGIIEATLYPHDITIWTL